MMILRMAAAVVWTIVVSLMTIVFSVSRLHGLFYSSVRLWGKGLLVIFGIKLRVRGGEQLDNKSRYIFTANHASSFDIPALLAAVPVNFGYMYKRELNYIPIFGWALAAAPYISIDRADARDAMKSIERSAAKIREKTSVLIFPEGTRTLDGNLQPFKRGGFTLAAQAGVPVVPVTINNSFWIMRKGSWAIRPEVVDVIIDAPIPTEGVQGREGEMRLMETVRKTIETNYTLDERQD